MIDGGYATGAIALAASLMAHSPNVPRFVMVTKEITPATRCALNFVYHYVVEIDYIAAVGLHMPYKRFGKMYEWINWSFTKLQVIPVANALNFQKVMLLDADVVALGDLSVLFELNSPAGILSCEDFSDVDGFSHAGRHGKLLPDDLVRNSIVDAYGIRGCLMVLNADLKDYERLMEAIQSNSTKSSAASASAQHNSSSGASLCTARAASSRSKVTATESTTSTSSATTSCDHSSAGVNSNHSAPTAENHLRTGADNVRTGADNVRTGADNV
eukprot:Lankesteria_metandrocarpae@DN4344_c1_g1_i1.p1